MTSEFIKRQFETVRKNYNAVYSDGVRAYFDIRPMNTARECVCFIFRNNEPIEMTFTRMPIELVCKNLKFGGF